MTSVPAGEQNGLQLEHRGSHSIGNININALGKLAEGMWGFARGAWGSG